MHASAGRESSIEGLKEVPRIEPSDAKPTSGPEALTLDSPELYINRELSLLEFQKRVLQEALKKRVSTASLRRFNYNSSARKSVGLSRKSTITCETNSCRPSNEKEFESWTFPRYHQRNDPH